MHFFQPLPTNEAGHWVRVSKAFKGGRDVGSLKNDAHKTT